VIPWYFEGGREREREKEKVSNIKVGYIIHSKLPFFNVSVVWNALEREIKYTVTLVSLLRTVSMFHRQLRIMQNN
jgi:hypothetical protein